jgi:hypothetical protein
MSMCATRNVPAGVIRTRRSWPWGWAGSRTGISISFSTALVVVLISKIFAGLPFCAITTWSRPIGWIEWVSVPGGLMICHTICLSGVTSAAPSRVLKTMFPFESCVQSPSSAMSGLLLNITWNGIEYDHTALPSRTSHIVCCGWV